MTEKKWYSPGDVEGLSAQERIVLTKEFINPGMVALFHLLGFDTVRASSAEGMYITLADGRKILDMTGGNGVLGLGHNHPRIIAAREGIARQKRLEISKSFLSPYMAALAADMAFLLPGDLQYSFFCNSGAEAVEGALKLAQKHHGIQRAGLVYTDHSFHGKTHAAMSVSSLDESRRHFQLLERCYQVPFGDAEALGRFFRQRVQDDSGKPDLCAFIVEAIHGTRIILPPAGYLQKVRALCNEYDVLLILDEIYTGFGRTGYWFAFEPEGIVPDIVCYSKTFGGGKATIAGYTTRAPVFLKAYGKTDECLMHSSTFSGMTEECAAALETLTVLKDEKLIEASQRLGDYLEKRLLRLKEKYPDRIDDIRGRGLLWGVELKPLLPSLQPFLKQCIPAASSLTTALTGAMVLSELFSAHGILSYLGFTRRNLIVFSPALIVTEGELDRAVDALDAVLAKGWPSLVQSFCARQLLK
jgi:putrescine aminotransferase